MPARTRRLALHAAALATAAYLAVCAWLFLTQQSRVFPGFGGRDQAAEAALERIQDIKRLQLDTPDGATLSGYLRPAARDGQSAPLLLYFEGNKDLCARFMPGAAEALPDFSVACLDYRGYGQSTGVPSQDALFADALFAYDRLERDTHAPRVAVMGRSLGSAMAAHVAAFRPVEAAVLVTPFDSVRAVGQSRHPFIPVGALLKHPFDASADAAKAKAPALVLIAGHDTIVPPAHGFKLSRAWGGPSRTTALNADHLTIIALPAYWPKIRAFLADK